MVGILTPINIINDAILCIGVALCIGVVAVGAYALMALDKGMPLLPWGPRSKVANAKALGEIQAERLKQELEDARQQLELDAIEIKALALAAKRDEVKRLVESGEEINLPELLAKVPERGHL